MATLFAQLATTWSLALWNSQADGLGTAQAPTSADTADVNGLAVSWDFTLDGGSFANALRILDGAGGGTFTFTGGTVATACNLTVDVDDNGSTSAFSVGIEFELTLNASLTTGGSCLIGSGGFGPTYYGELVIGPTGSLNGGGSLTVGGELTNNGLIGLATAVPEAHYGGGIFVGALAANNGTISGAVTLSGGILTNTAAGTLSGTVNLTVATATLLNAGTIGGTLTFTAGLIVSSVPLTTLTTIPAGYTLLITGGNWTGLTLANSGTVLDATATGCLATVTTNPVIKVPAPTQAVAGTAYGIAGFGADGTAGQLTGTAASGSGRAYRVNGR